MCSRASGGSCGDSVAARSAETMSSLRRRAICTQRAMSTERSATGGRASARTTAPASVGSASRRSQASTSRTSAWAKKSPSPTARSAIARSSKASATWRPSSRGERTMTPIRSGATPPRTSRSTSAATACAWARSSAAHQKRTVPPGAPRSGVPSRSAIGATTASAASSTRCGQRSDTSRRTISRARMGLLEVAHVLRRRRAHPLRRAVVVGADGELLVLGAEQLDEQRRGEAEVGVLVDEHVAVALGDPRAHVRALAQQRDGAQHELAGVERPDRGQQPVVVEVQLRELDLARAPGALGVVVVGQRLGPGGVVGGGDEAVLQPVDAIDDVGQQHGGPAADVVAAQVQVVHAVQQQREPVGARDRRRRTDRRRPRRSPRAAGGRRARARCGSPAPRTGGRACPRPRAAAPRRRPPTGSGRGSTRARRARGRRARRSAARARSSCRCPPRRARAAGRRHG